ncbi:MAG: hypothetical protein EBQ98_04680 [Actinobacteria bacterium]|nr:hypothetical protein [Actinomycetota bacterium]
MNNYWLINNALTALLLPPTIFVVLGISGLLIARRYLYVGRTLMVVSVTSLLALSTDAGSAWLLRPLEQQSLQATSTEKNKSQVIVVLGGGRAHVASGAGDYDQVGPITLMRLRAAARLQRQTHLPVLVTGGAPDGQGLRVAPVPSQFVASDDFQLARFITNAQSLKNSYYAIHEWLGLLVYRLRYAVTD